MMLMNMQEAGYFKEYPVFTSPSVKSHIALAVGELMIGKKYIPQAIVVCPVWWQEATKLEREFVLNHEAGHLLHGHTMEGGVVELLKNEFEADRNAVINGISVKNSIAALSSLYARMESSSEPMMVVLLRIEKFFRTTNLRLLSLKS